MRYKTILTISTVIFTIAFLAFFVPKSEAFNKFKSSEEESRINTESTDNLRAIKNSTEQILEQLKITNDLLRRQGGVATPAPSTSAPVPQSTNRIRANP